MDNSRKDERHKRDNADRGRSPDDRKRGDSRERNRSDRRYEQRNSRNRSRRDDSRRNRSRSRSDSRSRNRDRQQYRNEDKNKDRDNIHAESPFIHKENKQRDQYVQSTKVAQISKDQNQAKSSKQQQQPRWGRAEEYQEEEKLEEVDETKPQYKPDFGLSGALAKDERTGNVSNGVVLKFTEPFEAAKPDKKWRFYVYRGEELVETLHIHRRSCFLVGRDDRIADVPTLHPSCSLQHAVVQFREIEKKEMEDGERVVKTFIKPYIMDLKSTHGTFVNGTRIEDSRYYELLEGDVLKFGGSSREYVLLHDQSGKS